jgi:hypothetical protein
MLLYLLQLINIGTACTYMPISIDSELTQVRTCCVSCAPARRPHTGGPGGQAYAKKAWCRAFSSTPSVSKYKNLLTSADHV